MSKNKLIKKKRKQVEIEDLFLGRKGVRFLRRGGKVDTPGNATGGITMQYRNLSIRIWRYSSVVGSDLWKSPHSCAV